MSPSCSEYCWIYNDMLFFKTDLYAVQSAVRCNVDDIVYIYRQTVEMTPFYGNSSYYLCLFMVIDKNDRTLLSMYINLKIAGLISRFLYTYFKLENYIESR